MDDAPFLPYEYLLCFILAPFPPLWFYIMNPIVEALDDIKTGKKNEKGTRWNNMMPASADDVIRMRVGWAYIVSV